MQRMLPGEKRQLLDSLTAPIPREEELRRRRAIASSKAFVEAGWGWELVYNLALAPRCEPRGNPGNCVLT